MTLHSGLSVLKNILKRTENVLTILQKNIENENISDAIPSFRA